MSAYILYGYYRSSAAYRVRIALNYKDVAYQQEAIHLVRDGGEQFQEKYKKINPQSLVPSLQVDGHVLHQSLAIMEYLEETLPTPALLPKDSLGRARVRAIAQMIACDIHPLNNRRVLQYLLHEYDINEPQQKKWLCHWMQLGLAAIEKILVDSADTGDFCHGNTPTMADMCLIPQIYSAERFACSLDNYPTLRRINANCLELPYFQAAHPKVQPDAE